MKGEHLFTVLITLFVVALFVLVCVTAAIDITQTPWVPKQ
jgi:hypothetical protein